MYRTAAFILTALLGLATTVAQAQTQTQANEDAAARRLQALEQLDRDVWAPFMHGVNSFDDDSYLGTRSRDYVLVLARPGSFLDHDFYAEDSIQSMRSLKDAGSLLALEVRFEERLSDGEHASERGVTRTVLTDAKGQARTMYSRFHAISRREDGRWRVLTEYRWNAGAEADAAAFDAASPVGRAETRH